MPRTRLSKQVNSSSPAITSSASSNNSNTIIGISDTGEVAVSLPGLGEFSIDQADQFVPATNRENNVVTDLLNPQITDRVTDARKEELMRTYKEGINAEHAKQEGFKYIGEQFKTEQSRNNAVGEFVKVGKSIEDVKGNVIEYFTAVENNRERGAKYITAQAKANTAIEIIPETLATLDESLRQAQLKREKAMLKSQKEFNTIDQERLQLGEMPQLPPIQRRS